VKASCQLVNNLTASPSEAELDQDGRASGPGGGSNLWIEVPTNDGIGLWAFSRLAGPGVCERVPLRDNSHPFEDYSLAGSAAILCTGGLDRIRNEAWPFCRTSSGVRLCWELEEPKGPTGPGPPDRDAHHLLLLAEQERVFVELMTSDRKLEACRDGSKGRNYGT